jgi:hypothetical protein
MPENSPFPLLSTPLKSCFEVGSEQTAEEEDRDDADWSPIYSCDALEEEMREP